ncbi:hypothetical protein ACWKWP_06395 [Agromyces soli]
MADLSDDLDFSTLTEPVDPALARTTAERHEREHGIPAGGSRQGVGCLIAVILLVGLPATAIFAMGAVGTLWLLAPAMACLAATVWLCVRVADSAKRYDVENPPYRLHLERFAESNGLELLPKAPAPAPEGMLFGQSGNDERRHLRDVVRWPDDMLEVGEYHFMQTGGMYSPDMPAQRDYALIRLGRTAPSMVVHARANVTLAGGIDMREPTRFRARGGERLTLWAWRADTARARAIVDQQLVELLAGRHVDLEFLGDRAVLYSARPFDKADPETWRWLVEVARLLRARTAPAEA